MTRLKLTTFINAPISRCFDLSRSIDLHMLSTKKTGEKAVAGKISGLIVAGETVTWEAVHFGVKQKMTTRIIEMRPPDYFSDEMLEGAFKSMYHEHHFESRDGGTVMTDNFDYETPYGILGTLFDRLLLKKHMLELLTERNAAIKSVAEGNEWEKILNNKANV